MTPPSRSFKSPNCANCCSPFAAAGAWLFAASARKPMETRRSKASRKKFLMPRILTHSARHVFGRVNETGRSGAAPCASAAGERDERAQRVGQRGRERFERERPGQIGR